MKKNALYLLSIFIKNLKAYKWFILAVLGYVLYFSIFHHSESNCLIKRVTTVSCPSCGMTRAIISLVTLQFTEAFIYHPFVYVLPFLIIIVMFRGVKVIDYFFYSKLFWILVIFVVLIIYGIRITLYFPNVVPLEYTFSYIPGL